jgi:hypothetical protein
MRCWAANHDLGRMIGGRWRLSRVALQMLLESNRAALNAYLSGDRESDTVLAHFRRLGLTDKIFSVKNDRNEEKHRND